MAYDRRMQMVGQKITSIIYYWLFAKYYCKHLKNYLLIFIMVKYT